VAASKGVAFSKSPVLAVRLPTWRSRVVLFVLFAAFAALAGRALWLQGMSTQFLQKQGKSRYERTIELPATRGKIMDRNGQVLASSLPVKAVWAIPKTCWQVAAGQAARAGAPARDERGRAAQEARFGPHLRLPQAPGRDGRDRQDRRSSDRRPRHPQGIQALLPAGRSDDPPGRLHQRRRRGPGKHGTGAAEDAGRRDRQPPRDQGPLGRIVEDVGLSRSARRQGPDLSVDSKLQYIAFTRSIKAAVEKFKAKAGAAVVLDVHTGEVLALANWPTYNPNDRTKLTGEQLRNRVITDTFEPGSTLKPFTVALALETKPRHADHRVRYRPGRMVIGGAPIRDTQPHGVISVAASSRSRRTSAWSKMALG
jgi:cell division protein FtsI (penicillin-binding protein 3)